MKQKSVSQALKCVTVIMATSVFVVVGCATKLQSPDLGGLYNDLIQAEDPYRNPVIVVPGILGSKLKDLDSNAVVWGAFGPGSQNPKKPEAARLIALPMREGTPLAALHDRVRPDGVLDRVEVHFAGLDLSLKAYFYMLGTLGAGYRDSELGESGAIDYGEGHYTCFQFAYDWRRDIRASPPAGLSLYLIAGDAVPTNAVIAVDTVSGVTNVVKEAPGDGTVLRSSALMVEGTGTDVVGRLDSPIDWTSVHFLFTDHIGLTRDPGFSDNLLYFLFKKPK